MVPGPAKLAVVRPQCPLLSQLLSPARVSALLQRAHGVPGRPGRPRAAACSESLRPLHAGRSQVPGWGRHISGGHAPTIRARQSPWRSVLSSPAPHLLDLAEGRVTPLPCTQPTPGIPVDVAGGTPTTNAYRQLCQVPPTWHQVIPFSCPGAKRTPDDQARFYGCGLPPPSQGALCFLCQEPPVQGPPAQDPTTLCGGVRSALSFQTLDVSGCGQAGFSVARAGGGLAAHHPPPPGTDHEAPSALVLTTSYWHLPCSVPK